MRRAAIAAGAGVVLGAALLLFRRGDAWPAWLAAWVAWMALPLGALPLVAGARLVGHGARLPDGAFVAALRPLLWMLPAGAVLGVPLLLALPGREALGVAALLVVWSALALLLVRPGRWGGAAFGGIVLALHIPLLSLAAGAAARALDPGFVSSSFGLLVISAQAGAAAAAALLAAAASGAAGGSRGAARLVAGLIAAWLFLHFSQYLIIWSADLPAEVVWYQLRATGLGGALIGLAAVAALAAIAVLSGGAFLRPRALLATGAALLALHVLEMLWLVTPAYRGRFVVDFADATALAAGVCLAAALLRLAAGPRARGSEGGTHVAA